MQFKKIVPYRLKQMVPVLGLAGAGMLSSCEKSDQTFQSNQ